MTLSKKYFSKQMDFDICVYHKGCPDGIGGAWPFWRERRKAVFFGGEHSIEPNIDLFIGKKVIFVDFAYGKEIMIQIKKVARSILILDHHKTTVKNLKTFASGRSDYCFVELILDMERSGAQIAWDYVYPSKTRPWFIDIIADRDLWKWEIPNSKEIGSALYEFGWYTWEKMEEIYINDISPTRFLDRGKILRELNDSHIKRVVEYASPREFLGYRVNLITGEPGLRSEAGHLAALQEGIDFSAFWRYSEENGQFWISLRGREDGIDLTELCEKFGGGGHPKACGFTIHTSESKEWQEADTVARLKMAHGLISDYFKKY